MAGNEALDDAIGTWLEEAAPRQLPTRVLAATFERTRRTRQETAWRIVPRRLQMPRMISFLEGAAIVVVTAVLALNVIPRVGPGATPTSTPPPPSAGATASPQVTAFLNGFLEARIAGAGAKRYLDQDMSEADIPLLYATTSGARYDRGEFQPVSGYAWPYGWTAFKVRLFAGGTVVEQLVFISADDPLKLSYQGDGFATDVAPTTEDGQPLALAYSYYDGEVSLRAAQPWVFYPANPNVNPGGRLIPNGPGVQPTTDGAQRNDWDKLYLMADPVLVATNCQPDPDSADAQGLARKLASYTGVETSEPLATSVGGADGLMMDVLSSAGTSIFPPTDGTGNFCANALLAVLLGDGSESIHGASGDRMRLYLVNMPAGSSVRVMGIAIVAPDPSFQRAVDAAAPVLDSIEFHPR